MIFKINSSLSLAYNKCATSKQFYLSSVSGTLLVVIAFETRQYISRESVCASGCTDSKWLSPECLLIREIFHGALYVAVCEKPPNDGS